MRDQEALLSIAVPAYNAAATLGECLASLCHEGLEVIVVDDGSTDGTAALAEAFAAAHPGIFRLIRQENRGHGGAVNTALRAARGRYFRVVDGDDLLENLEPYLEKLRCLGADVLLCAYTPFGAGPERPLGPRREARLDMEGFSRFFSRNVMACTIHALTFRRELLTGMELPQGVSYEDEVFVTLPFARAESVALSPLPVYRYRQGREGQSMALPGRIARVDHLYTVMEALLGAWPRFAPGPRRRYLGRRLRGVAHNYFELCLVHMPRKAQGRRMAARFLWRMCRQAPWLSPMLLACFLRFLPQGLGRGSG